MRCIFLLVRLDSRHLGLQEYSTSMGEYIHYSLTLRMKGYLDLVVVGYQSMFSVMPIPNSIKAFVINKFILFASYHHSE